MSPRNGRPNRRPRKGSPTATYVQEYAKYVGRLQLRDGSAGKRKRRRNRGARSDHVEDVEGRSHERKTRPKRRRKRMQRGKNGSYNSTIVNSAGGAPEKVCAPHIGADSGVTSHRTRRTCEGRMHALAPPHMPHTTRVRLVAKYQLAVLGLPSWPRRSPFRGSRRGLPWTSAGGRSRRTRP